MEAEFKREGEAGRLRLAGELDIYAAGSLRERLLEAAAAGGDVTVELAEVTLLDSCAVQLLLAAERALAGEGRRLAIAPSSQAVEEVLALLRLFGRGEGGGDGSR